ncbi:hypothetical protein [Kitasatospora cineracea]|uniref:hypothetical protein n=1 Tax=Kitasatospora cineracea TaxID=88074 RepID=UPI0033DE3806
MISGSAQAADVPWRAEFNFSGPLGVDGGVWALDPEHLAEELIDVARRALGDDDFDRLAHQLVMDLPEAGRQTGTWASVGQFRNVHVIVVCQEPGVPFVPDPLSISARYEDDGVPLLLLALHSRVSPVRLVRLMRVWGIPLRWFGLPRIIRRLRLSSSRPVPAEA